MRKKIVEAHWRWLPSSQGQHDDLFLIQEQASGLHTTMCSGSLGFSGVSILDKSVEPPPKGLGLQV
jgi:hypothetical protein